MSSGNGTVNGHANGYERIREAAARMRAESGGKGRRCDEPEPVVFTDPVPLVDQPPPPMPRNCMVGWIGAFADEVATALEVSREMTVMHALAALATAVQGRFTVRPEPGYFEPLCLFVAAADVSGSRKSATQRYFLDPFIAWERRQCAAVSEEVKRLTTRQQILDGQIKAKREHAKKLGGEELDAALKEIEELEAERPVIPALPRVYTGDCTVEHLGTMLAQQGERMAVWSDEGGFFDLLAGRYSNGVANLDLPLQAYSGSPVRVDRGSRASVILNHPVLTICLTPQPDVLKGLAARRDFRGRGLLARFDYVAPPSNLGFRTLQACPVRDQIANDYREAITSLLDLPPKMDGEQPVPYVLMLDADAHAEWKQLQHDVELMMQPKGKLDGLTDVGGKLPGQAARIAGLLHLAEHASVADTHLTIGAATMRRAVSIARTCLEHGLHVFGMMGVDDSLEIARRLWDEVVKLDKPAVTAREVWHPTRGKYPRMSMVDGGFDVLTERGWLVEQTDVSAGRGRPAKRRFLVNPKAMASGHFGHAASDRGV